MNKTARFLLQFTVVTLILSIVVMLGWKPITIAQDEKADLGKSARPSKFEAPDLNSDEVSLMEVDTSGFVIDDREPVGFVPEGDGPPPGPFDGEEQEPNGTTGTATALPGLDGRVRGYLSPAADVDVYAITVPAGGGKLYAATQTASSAGSSSDTVIDVIGTDGTTVMETDDNDGTMSATGASVAGLTLPSAGTYYVRVRIILATATVRPYHVYYAWRSLALAETEPNDTVGQATALNGHRQATGSITPAADKDTFSFPLNAGDTVFLSLNIDPERDDVQWNGRLGFGLFGTGVNALVQVNDASTGSPSNPLSEALFFTVKDSGTYFVQVDEAAGGVGNTYSLSLSILPAESGSNCTTHNSSDIPKVIDSVNPGMVSSNITIPPGHGRIDDLQVFLSLNHTFMQDLDFNLVSPAGNDNGLFSDIGAGTVGGPQTTMSLWVDDRAAVPPFFPISAGFRVQPEVAHRLEFFNGEDPTGTWRLDVRDDATGDGGTLNNWSIRICEQDPTPPGTVNIFSQDFEAGAGGFTHSGTADEWERGTPNTAATGANPPVAAFSNCHSGTNCWKTDLDGTYDINSNQDLDSPPIAIPPGAINPQLSWAMRYQFESASFDHAWVEVFESGNPSNREVLGAWDGANMSSSVGNPAINIGQSAGWGVFTAPLDNFAGDTVVIRFHLDSDSSVNFGGLAIDDVKVTRFAPAVPVSISGRILTLGNRGIAGARVVLTEQNGTPRLAITSSFGYYEFPNVLSQQSVALSASSKRYTCPSTNFSVVGATTVGLFCAASP